MRIMIDRGILTSITTIIRRPAARAVLGSLACAIVLSLAFQVSLYWAAQAAPTTLTLRAGDAIALQDVEGQGVTIAGYEGSFDPQSKRLVIRGGGEITRRVANGATLNSRIDPSQEVPRNTAYTFAVVNSTFLSSGDQAGNISGEIRLNNQSGATLYNTRIVFTRFNRCPPTGACDGSTATTPADTTPGTTGFSYYNDGLIPYQGKLHVSRAYGDIPPNGNSSAVWSFNVSTTPVRFFFAFVVLSDWGVAAESVYPAAVQVNASAGAGIVIRGRGFSGSPTVTLLNAGGATVATLGNVTVTNDSQITATVPANTPPGIYSVRVTLAGGTAGGQNSSVIRDRLTVTAVPSATLSGAVSGQLGVGPFLVTGDVAMSNVTITPGAVFYVNNNVRVSVGASTSLTANGGVPGVPNAVGVASPTQIVFTAQRSPGAGLPSAGAWAGLDMTAPGQPSALRNVVVEFGGGTNGAGVNLTNSGREVRFTDSIARFSAGSGLTAAGVNDMLIGFTRNRIEYNGLSAATPAMLLSANAALGLYDMPNNAVPAGTSVSDGSYFYTGANDFTGNSLDAIQIGTDGDQAANDFTKSGVLVGQGTTPLQIRGSNTNPAVVGTVAPATAAEVTIAPGALIQLAAGLDFQAGDYGTSRRGCIAANGFAGVNQVPNAALTNSRYIVFDRIGTSGNFGSIFFARNALTSCLLAFVQVRNGGASVRGNGAVISEGANLVVRNSQVSNSATGGIIELQGGLLAGSGNTANSNGSLIIDTVVGGFFGDGNLAAEATVQAPLFVATDTQGRGVFFVDGSSSVPVIRFVNTTRNPLTLAGQTIPAGTMKTLAGGGLDLQDNAPGLSVDLGIVTGLAVSHTGNAVYYIDSITPAIRFLNISTSAITLGGQTINSGRVGTLLQGGVNPTIVSLSVHPTNGDVYFCDASSTNSRVYRVPATGGSAVLVAGSGGTTVFNDNFEATAPTAQELLSPRAVLVDGSGNVFVADSDHQRIVNVGVNPVTLVAQFPKERTLPANSPYKNRPFPAGLAIAGGQLYIAMRAAHNVVRADGSANPADVAGLREVPCDYTTDNCGDGGLAKGTAGVPPSGGRFTFINSGTVGVAGDANGLFLCDQANSIALRGRIRYVNVTNNPVEVAGKTINGNSIDTVFGSGLPKPFDHGLANAAALAAPSGVGVEPGTGNLWITEGGNLRYVNRTPRPVTLFANTDSVVTVQPGRIATANSQAGQGSSPDNIQVLYGGFDTPQGVWVTSQGVYVADSRGGPGLLGTNTNLVNRRTSRIRFVNTSSQPVTFYQSGVNPITIAPGVISTIVGGNPEPIRSAEDGPDPLLARLVGALDVAVASNGDIYLCEAGNKRVRRVNRTTGVVTSIPSTFLPGATDPGVATNATNAYTGLTFDNQGRLLVVDAGSNAILREKSPGSAFTTGFDIIISGSPLNSPRDVAVDSTGTFAYVTNAGPLFPVTGDHRVLRLTLSGNSASAATFAGSAGVKGYMGDYGPPQNALLNMHASGVVISVQGGTVLLVVPTLNIVTGLNGEVIFADTVNNAIRRIR